MIDKFLVSIITTGALLSLAGAYISAALVLIVGVLLCRADQAPIFQIYERPGRWFLLKYGIMRFLFWAKPRPKVDACQLERLQPFSDSPQAFDAIFFDGANQEGDCFILGCERRPNGIVNGLFYLKTKEEGVLLSSKLPNTELLLPTSGKVDYYGAEGIKVVPIEPMRKWLVSYEGKMRSQENPDKIFDVKFSGYFQSPSDEYFSFDTDFSRHGMAYSMAKEPWSSEYLQQLVKAHQNHYEQIGKMDATIVLGVDTPPRLRSFQVFRDHSYGFQRDWLLMHRFTFQVLFISDGAALIMGNVCQPCTCSELVIGYYYHQGRYTAIKSSDYKLYQHGESGRPPLDYAFTAYLDNDTELEVRIEVQDGGIHFVGENRMMKVHERFVKCEVNGVDGRGVSECVYNQVGVKRRID